MRYIRLDENRKVISVRYGSEILEGEIESEFGEVGQIMLHDGTFIDDVSEQPMPESDPISQLSEKIDLLIMMMLEREGII